ncbi:hypothetical protein PLICRDRAFT_171919 [Plicaturopsis crispa FD-325 SS-3]|nr:hypothetical protein PLICRDRAFT_171919 [Plicaturopsis crispa FD-325 SS-3]
MFRKILNWFRPGQASDPPYRDQVPRQNGEDPRTAYGLNHPYYAAPYPGPPPSAPPYPYFDPRDPLQLGQYPPHRRQQNLPSNGSQYPAVPSLHADVAANFPNGYAIPRHMQAQNGFYPPHTFSPYYQPSYPTAASPYMNMFGQPMYHPPNHALPPPTELTGSNVRISGDPASSDPPPLGHTERGGDNGLGTPMVDPEDPSSNDDWPVGYHRREQPKGNETPLWKHTKWVWRSQGHVTHNDAPAERRVCLGVMRCNTCGRLSRPKTEAGARQIQLSEGCRAPGCVESQDSPLLHETCDAKSFHFTVRRQGRAYLVWEHFGMHDHDRPPGGGLSRTQELAVDAQVLRHQNASAHQLRTGDSGPGSVPLAAIAPPLANPRTARYQISKSQSRVGIQPSSGKGGLSVLHELGAVNEKLGSTFLIDSGLLGPTYITLQTSFMDTCIREAVEAWIEDREDSPVSSRHGFVTDGDHTFFRSGNLLTTCSFNTTMQAWVPVLYSWIDGLDTAHHQPHFKALFNSVVKHAGKRFKKEYLTHIMDFSVAQRNAHAEEYASVMLSRLPSVHDLSNEAIAVERRRYIEEARAAEIGCETHFYRSSTRLKKNGLLVPPALINTFDDYIRQLMSVDTDDAQFAAVVRDFNVDFPRCHGWLKWWLRPTIASMIFASKRVMESELMKKYPTSSNPVEHQHSLLHHATQIDNDLIPGIKGLYLHIRELEEQYNAIRAGHFNPEEPRKKSRPARPHWDANDGRAPDTYEALATTSAMHHDAAADPSHTRAVVIPERLLVSYRWDVNSCFFDSSLQLWFHAYYLWSPETRETIVAALGSKPVISSIFYHFLRRLQWITKPSLDDLVGRRELDLMQRLVRHAIFGKWKLYPNPKSYGCAKRWLRHAVQELDEDTQRHFSVQHTSVMMCPKGHILLLPASSPVLFLRITKRDVDTLRHVYGTTGGKITTEQYFQHFVPQIDVSEDSGRTIPVHTLYSKDLVPCGHRHCQDTVSISDIQTSWPQLLHIIPEPLVHHVSSTDFAASNPLHYERTFCISNDAENHEQVQYELVGRVLYLEKPSHFVTQMLLGNRTVRYDDMDDLLVDSGPSSILEKPNRHTSFLLYHRISKVQTSTQTIETITSNYNKAPP